MAQSVVRARARWPSYRAIWASPVPLPRRGRPRTRLDAPYCGRLAHVADSGNRSGIMSFSSPFEPGIPDDMVERARMLEQVMVTSCTGGTRDETNYKTLRGLFLGDDLLKSLLPPFVRTS